MVLTCNNSRLTSPRIAHHLPALAPSLAPRNPWGSARTGSGPAGWTGAVYDCKLSTWG
jgi:hypothetical protein